jgi:hypothetical protein
MTMLDIRQFISRIYFRFFKFGYSQVSYLAIFIKAIITSQVHTSQSFIIASS